MPAELFIILIALVGFWLIVMRPARVQQRQVAQLQSDLAPGDPVVISAGIFGTIVSVEDDRVSLEIAPGTVITVARQVVVRRAPEPGEDADGPAVEDQADQADEAAGTVEDPADRPRGED